MIKTTLFFLIFGLSAKAQVSGMVTDGTTHLPVPYVNIYLDDKRWVSAEENGSFAINAGPEELLSFSAIGYETVKIKAADASRVSLKPISYALETVTISKPEMKIEKPIGGYDRKLLDLYYTTGGAPEMLARYFPPDPEARSTPFLKTLIIATKSLVRNAKFNIHILEANADGTPGRELSSENIIGTAKKGTQNTKVILMPYQLRMPENGFFVALEWLIIPENRCVESHYTDKQGVYHEHVEYAPFLASVRTDNDTTTSWGFRAGYKWSQFTKVSPERIQKYYEDFKKSTGNDAPPFDDRYSDFAMKLILTN